MSRIQCVIGVGDAGGIVLNRIKEIGINDATLMAANTYGYALVQSAAHVKIQLGSNSMMGAGGSLEMGKKAAEESLDTLKEHLESADKVVIVAGMGGGTGSGASPVIAQLTSMMGIRTLAVVSLPTTYEGIHRKQIADRGVSVLRTSVEDLVTVETNKLIKLMSGTDFDQRVISELMIGALAWQTIFKLMD